MEIRFLNHASFYIEYKDIKILTDPYIFGPSFNNGWKLLQEFDHSKYLKDITHIFFSHEHPDHFSVPFLKSINEQKRKNIKIIFQKTYDQRVKIFCKKLGYEFIECESLKEYKISENFYFKIGKVPFFDSWINFRVNNKNILNVNDCVLEDENVVYEIKKNIKGSIDILFTQFSIAGYIPDIKIDDYAKNCLKKIKLQDKILNPKKIVPFASFIYFSHEENKLMNKGLNDIKTVYEFIKTNCNAKPLIVKPNEIINLNESNNEGNLNFWMNFYSEIHNLEYEKSSGGLNVDTLLNKNNNYIKKVYKKNSKWLLYILYKVGFIKPIKIYVSDLKLNFVFNILNGLTLDKDRKTSEDSLIIHSNSLAYIFDYDFGFDTLMVNARFHIKDQFISRLIRNFMLGSIMNTGRYIKISNVFKFMSFNLIKRVLNKIFN